MYNFILIFIGKILSALFRIFHLGNGSTWPGHIALHLNPKFTKELLRESRAKIILIAGTNGKTTTASMIRTVLEQNGKSVLQNQSGANLLNGLASTLLLKTNLAGKITQDYAIFEVDENILPLLLKKFKADYIILNNLFRDQLDRYGEVDTIARKWKESLNIIARKNGDAISAGSPGSARDEVRATTLILNADDPQIAFLGKDLKAKTLYYGLDSKDSSKELEHAADSIYCPNCGEKLQYSSIIFSHLGNWSCPKCKLKRPKLNLSEYPYFPLSGTYNKYNTLAAVAVLQDLGLSEEQIRTGLKAFTPAFGRQERIEINGKYVQIFLSKNPTGFNESLRTICQLEAKHVLFALNDGIADGRDVSWIWDIDFETFLNGFESVIVSGNRAYDMGLRLKYAEKGQRSKVKNQNQSLHFKILLDLNEAVQTGIERVGLNETLYILPTYTAMLEVRKVLTGKKIL